jgi:hypothetical protein
VADPSQSLPNAPPAPSQPLDMTQPSIPSQTPEMATPTFNPAQSAAPTTAATSPQAAAPNMIGDLFGTSFSGFAPVLIDSLLAVGGDPLVLGTSFDPLSSSAFSSPLSPAAVDIQSFATGASTTTAIPGLSVTTVNSQSSLISADPSLSSPVRIVNNPAVQSAVEDFGASLHGVGQAIFDADNSAVALNPIFPMGPGTIDTYPVAGWNYDYLVNVEVAGLSNPGGAPGAFVGRQKLAENTSPLPRDRVFVNYSYFHNTPLLREGVNVNRVTPGIEKTFFNGMMSLEVRAPFATTLDSDILLGGPTNTSNAEFGNLTLYWKTLVWDADIEFVTAGVGLSLPTASDVEARQSNGVRLLQIENESVHILPFVGALFLPTDRTFVQSFLQFDLDPNGNTVRFSDFDTQNGVLVPTGNLLNIGRPNDADFVFFDIAFGYWIYQNHCSPCCVRGIAPTLELHYNGTVREADSAFANRGNVQLQFGNGEQNDLDLWNVVLGVNVALRHNAMLTCGYAAPLDDDDDEQFDGELRVILNWFFGGPDRFHSCF